MNSNGFAQEVSRFIEEVKASFTSRMEENRDSTADASSEDKLQRAILHVLTAGPRTGMELVADIRKISAGYFTPSESQVFTLLNELVSEGLVVFELRNELRSYSITPSGNAWLDQEPSASSNEQADTSTTDLLKAKAKLGKSGVQLGQALGSILTSDSVELNQTAAQLIEATTKKLFVLMAENGK